MDIVAREDVFWGRVLERLLSDMERRALSGTESGSVMVISVDELHEDAILLNS
jgi:hypothetical protein